MSLPLRWVFCFHLFCLLPGLPYLVSVVGLVFRWTRYNHCEDEASLAWGEDTRGGKTNSACVCVGTESYSH